MIGALQYLVRRFAHRISEFLIHWYVHGFYRFWNFAMTTVRSFDQTIALSMTLRYFFQPLYQDYSFVGRSLGILFRSFRVLVGGLFYGVFLLIIIVAYIVWIFIPPYLLSRVFYF